ncbi:acyl carrier protein [Cryobacterium melibiosiphilum]|uniref:Acyl carrier protein n=1 Tax=Cryobacterium melibiosiphilum TaxID=995039 RepID=A0A3A5MKQ9_9MICO|nr:acyl carrier protein [Cryobacterium melibiosiphilum]RJT89962.1 acyl carrier protein [Cryobacterium melibiosiphilum]
MDKNEIKQILAEEIASELAMPADQIDDQASFMRLGISSVQALKVVNRLRKRIEMDINPVVIFEFKTIDDIAEHLAEEAEDLETSYAFAAVPRLIEGPDQTDNHRRGPLK